MQRGRERRIRQGISGRNLGEMSVSRRELEEGKGREKKTERRKKEEGKL